MPDEPDETRRRILLLTATGATAGLAGCGGGADGDDGGDEPAPSPTDSPAPTSTPGGGGGGTPEPVPEEYVTATALGGTQRNPDGLSSQAAVRYQSRPKNGQQCSDCRFYIPDKNGDELGACAIVAGKVAPEGWCVSYAPIETETDSA
jgi:hypothetical protein